MINRLPVLLLPLLLVFGASCPEREALRIPAPSPPPTVPMDSIAPPLTFLALGDSYTIGTAVGEAERWPVQLAAALRRDSLDVTAPDIVAVNGWTTTDLQRGISERRDELRPTYDLVSLLIGVNNQFQGKPLSEYTVEFEDLLRTALSFAGQDTGRVFVVSIPDYAFTPFGGGRADISTELVRFNATAEAISARYHVPFYNITPISQQGLDQPDLVADDRLHPSGKQYRRWVEEVLREPVRGQLRD